MFLSRLPDPPAEGNYVTTSRRLEEAASVIGGFIERHGRDAKIVIFGDYDADGTCSASILFLLLRSIGCENVYPMTSERQDGYGLTDAAVKRLVGTLYDPERTLVVAGDMGVKSWQVAPALLERGASLVVIDHHEPGGAAREGWEEIRRAYGRDRVYCYDPKLWLDDADEAELSTLSAAGLCYLVALHLVDRFEGRIPPAIELRFGEPRYPFETVLNTMAKIAALAQPADCMPFVREGRKTTAYRLALDYSTPGALLPGMALLYQLTATASRVSWVTAPIINACGRQGKARLAFELMTAGRPDEAKALFDEASEARRGVQGLTKSGVDNIEEMTKTFRGVTVLLGEEGEVSDGVVGILAAKASEIYKGPSLHLVHARDGAGGEVVKGSMRQGLSNFNCELWVSSLVDRGIALRGGGHPAAAGVTIDPARLDDLYRDAEAQTYTLRDMCYYEVSVDDADSFRRRSGAMAPFGRGNESPLMIVRGRLSFVKPLVLKTGEVWAYTLTVEDETSGSPATFKLVAGKASPEIEEFLLKISGRGISLGVEFQAQVFDNLKPDTAEGARFELRIERHFAILEAGQRVRDKVASFPTDEGRLFFDRDERRVYFETLSGEVTSGLEADGEGEALGEAALDTLVDKILSNVDPRIVIEVDRIDELPDVVFTIKRPSRKAIEEKYGEAALDDLWRLHGGVYNDKLYLYLTTYGAVESLFRPEVRNHPHFRFSVTARARAHYEYLKRQDEEIAVLKNDARPYDIPGLRPEITPTPMQYADVRYYLGGALGGNVPLCLNDMGTGKTLEAVMYGSLHHYGAELDSARNVVMPKTAKKRKPVLVVTLSNVYTQFSEEISKFSTLNHVTLSYEAIKPLITKDLSADYDREMARLLPRRRASRPQGGLDGDAPGTIKIVKRVGGPDAESFRRGVIGDAAFVVASYDLIARHPWIVRQVEWAAVVMDEFQEAKNEDAYKAVAIFGENGDLAPVRGTPVLLMSGTPITNRPGDWYLAMRVSRADGGVYTGRLSESVASGRFRFDTRFDGLRKKEIWTRGGKRFVYEHGEAENGEELQAIIYRVAIRRSKAELGNIPPITESVDHTPSSGLYREVLMALVNGSPIGGASAELLSRYSLLGPAGGLVEDIEDEDEGAETTTEEVRRRPAKRGQRAKIDAQYLASRLALVSSLDKAANLKNILERLKWLDRNEKGEIEPLVIIASHRAAVREVSRQLDLLGISHHLMRQEDSTKERNAKKKSFMAGEVQAFVTTYRIGGVGLNLTRANRELLIGLPWTPFAIEQARDRIHRYGQTRPVHVSIAILGGSIDEIIWNLLREKSRVNLKTLSLDKMKKGEFPAWALGRGLHTIGEGGKRQAGGSVDRGRRRA